MKSPKLEQSTKELSLETFMGVEIRKIYGIPSEEVLRKNSEKEALDDVFKLCEEISKKVLENVLLNVPPNKITPKMKKKVQELMKENAERAFSRFQKNQEEAIRIIVEQLGMLREGDVFVIPTGVSKESVPGLMYKVIKGKGELVGFPYFKNTPLRSNVHLIVLNK